MKNNDLNITYMELEGYISEIFTKSNNNSYLHFITFKSNNDSYTINIPMNSGFLELLPENFSNIFIMVAKYSFNNIDRYKLININIKNKDLYHEQTKKYIEIY